MTNTNTRVLALLLGCLGASLAAADTAQGADTAPVAGAAEQVTPAAATSPTVVPERPRLICRREQELGSHVFKRVCRTREEMRAQSSGARSAFENVGRAPEGDRGEGESNDAGEGG